MAASAALWSWTSPGVHPPHPSDRAVKSEWSKSLEMKSPKRPLLRRHGPGLAPGLVSAHGSRPCPAMP